jgi:hypothetical protein
VTEAGTEGEGERDLGVTTAAGSRRYPVAWELVRLRRRKVTGGGSGRCTEADKGSARLSSGHNII